MSKELKLMFLFGCLTSISICWCSEGHNSYEGSFPHAQYLQFRRNEVNSNNNKELRRAYQRPFRSLKSDESKLCGKWDSWCIPETQNPAMRCCSRLTCKCNFWATSCKCRSSVFGKLW